jgi:hypothetical protein
MKRWIALLAAGWQSLGCTADKNPTPPDYSPTGGDDNQVTCDYLREEKPPVSTSSRFTVDGGQAGCAATGLQCSLGACDGGTGSAQCYAGYWVFSCEAAEGGKDATVTEAEAASEAAP